MAELRHLGHWASESHARATNSLGKKQRHSLANGAASLAAPASAHCRLQPTPMPSRFPAAVCTSAHYYYHCAARRHPFRRRLKRRTH